MGYEHVSASGWWLVIWLVWVAWFVPGLAGLCDLLGRWLMCLFDALQYASRSFSVSGLRGLDGGREASSGLFVDDRAGVFGCARDLR